MSYYHIRITPKSNPSNVEAELDLSKEMLEERFIRRYKRGLPIVIDGRTVTPDNIGRMQVSKSEEDSSMLNDALRRQNVRQNVSMPIDYRGRVSSVILASMGEDLTTRYITAPPGGDVQAATNTALNNRPAADVRDVFVVHGRNVSARNALFEFLRAIDLHPLEWSEAVSGTGKASPYIGEVLDVAFSRAHAVVILFTPDDEARLKNQFWVENEPPHETQLTGQARPNVLFEAGMAMGRNQDRTVIVELGILRPFSDIGGRHVIRLNDTSQSRQELAQRLRDAGSPVKLDGTQWHTAGGFDTAIAPSVQESSESSATSDQQSLVSVLPQLSEEATELLLEAVKTDSAIIYRYRTMGGVFIKTTSKSFVEPGDRRLEAKWEQAIQDLLAYELIVTLTYKMEAFEVTHKGFQLADALQASQ